MIILRSLEPVIAPYLRGAHHRKPTIGTTTLIIRARLACHKIRRSEETGEDALRTVTGLLCCVGRFKWVYSLTSDVRS